MSFWTRWKSPALKVNSWLAASAAANARSLLIVSCNCPEPGDRYGVIGRCRPVSRVSPGRGGWSWAGFAALFAFLRRTTAAVDSVAIDMAPAPGAPRADRRELEAPIPAIRPAGRTAPGAGAVAAGAVRARSARRRPGL